MCWNAPLTCISFFFDRIFFGKSVTLRKVVGNLLIIIGIIVCLNR